MKHLRTGVIVPHRNDRPQFLKHLFIMLDHQTIKPDVVRFMGYPPKSDKVDITERYRKGYEKIKADNVDVIFFMENDDWYSPVYIETMLYNWVANGKPELFGTSYVIYYNLNIKKYFKNTHMRLSQSMNTMIKPNLNIGWPLDHDPFTDVWLWHHMKGITFAPNEIISLGIKHGIGKCGGKSHVDNLHQYIHADNGFLKKTVDKLSYDFYMGLGK